MKKTENAKFVKNELQNLYYRIAESKAIRHFDSETINFDAIIDQFHSVKNHERPDGIILQDNTVYMVEHFQNSIYWSKGKDRLKEALNPNNTRGTYLALTAMEQIMQEKPNGLNHLLNNWLQGFSTSLEKHMKKYPEYLKNTKSLYPNYPCKFILLVEDNSFAIISNDSVDDFSILDLSDFVECILKYPEIDGVIVYKSNTIGSAVIAKDRNRMQNDKKQKSLASLILCNIVSAYGEIFSPEQRQELQNQIGSILVAAHESFSLSDKIQVFKSDLETAIAQDDPNMQGQNLQIAKTTTGCTFNSVNS